MYLLICVFKFIYECICNTYIYIYIYNLKMRIDIYINVNAMISQCLSNPTFRPHLPFTNSVLKKFISFRSALIFGAEKT